MDQRGTSLLEVIITAVIIGLLASIATLSVNYYFNDGKSRIAQGDLATLAAATRLYILDRGFPATFDPADLVNSYIPELPVDPFADDKSGYVFAIRSDPTDHQTKIFIGSRGPDGAVDYGEQNRKDDLYRYVR